MRTCHASTLSLLVLLAVLALPAFAARLGFEADFKGEQAGSDGDSTLTEVVVTKVEPGSPAQRGGLRTGDVIEQMDGVAVPGRSSRAFYEALSSIGQGRTVELTVLRAGQRVSLRIVAGGS